MGPYFAATSHLAWKIQLVRNPLDPLSACLTCTTARREAIALLTPLRHTGPIRASSLSSANRNKICYCCLDTPDCRREEDSEGVCNWEDITARTAQCPGPPKLTPTSAPTSSTSTTPPPETTTYEVSLYLMNLMRNGGAEATMPRPLRRLCPRGVAHRQPCC